MYTRQQIQRKTRTQSSSSPTETDLFRQRPFNNEASPSTAQPQNQEAPNLQTQLERAERFGHNFGRLQVDNSTPAIVQPKLAIGAPGDKYEQEADQMASQVMSMNAPASQKSLQRQETKPEEEEVQMKPLASMITPLVQRQETPAEEELQAKPLLQRQEAPAEEELQAKRSPQESEASHNDASENLENQLNSSKGGGSPLPDNVRSFMEPRFGADFSQVRVHTDTQAVQMNQAVGAQAFTHGSDIYFGSGKSPAISDLTAHELTHVVQQTGAVQQSKAVLPAPVQQIQREGEGQLDKTKAQDALLEWQEIAHQFIDGNRAWLSANWIEYLGRTSQNPRLAWSDATTASFMSNALGNLVTELGQKLIKKGSAAAAGAMVGTAAAPGVGTVIGFAVGVLIESIASSIFETISGKTAAEEAASDASRRTAKLILGQVSAFETEASAARSQLQKAFKAIQKNLTNATTQEQVDQILNWAVAEKSVTATSPTADDRSLFQAMLKDWVLEHAGDEEDANANTSETDWERARTEVFGEGDSLDGHPEIFAYQSRSHWDSVGLPGTVTANQMIEKVKQIQGDKPQDAAEVVTGYYDGKTYLIESAADPERLIGLIDEEEGLLEEGKECIRKNQFTMYCTLDLSEADGAVYVNEWEYEVNLTGDLPFYASNSGSFDISPD